MKQSRVSAFARVARFVAFAAVALGLGAELAPRPGVDW